MLIQSQKRIHSVEGFVYIHSSKSRNKGGDMTLPIRSCLLGVCAWDC